jgi:hypothetical protein
LVVLWLRSYGIATLQWLTFLWPIKIWISQRSRCGIMAKCASNSWHFPVCFGKFKKLDVESCTLWSWNRIP